MNCDLLRRRLCLCMEQEREQEINVKYTFVTVSILKHAARKIYICDTLNFETLACWHHRIIKIYICDTLDFETLACWHHRNSTFMHFHVLVSREWVVGNLIRCVHNDQRARLYRMGSKKKYYFFFMCHFMTSYLMIRAFWRFAVLQYFVKRIFLRRMRLVCA